jgi:hypothetical protein
MSERLGKWNFWVMFLAFNLGFFPMHISGLLGMPRRIFTYPESVGWDTVNLITSIGSYIFAVGVLLFVINFFWSLFYGPPAGDNPWDAGSLEWATSSPPPAYNFAVIPTIGSREPLWEERLGLGKRSVIHHGPSLDAGGKETIQTTPLDGQPVAVLRMPEDSLWPLIVSLSLMVAFYGLVMAVWWLALAGGILTLFGAHEWLWPAGAEVEA